MLPDRVSNPNLINIPFILSEGISKSKLLNSILNFAILSVFNVRNVLIEGQRTQSIYNQRKACPPPPIF